MTQSISGWLGLRFRLKNEPVISSAETRFLHAFDSLQLSGHDTF